MESPCSKWNYVGRITSSAAALAAYSAQRSSESGAESLPRAVAPINHCFEGTHE
ncbi:hypothetical protein T4E_6870 [Trichinella pseudospiralis]|uniref:Uncharacterized protein n=1 Tax=Trichinella pseudospiralis TaxID=6337 RepID=A0A0V0XD98_TRIPS|nr:hypothetical protein T4E_6870 [Trichinella pseudospiralis]